MATDAVSARIAVCRRLALAAAILLLPAAAAQPAEATTLIELLQRIDGNPAPQPPCFEPGAEPTVPLERPRGRCAADTVAALFLTLLRDRERLTLLRNAIARQRGVLELVQQSVEAGASSAGDSLLAEIELKRWQVEEAELVRAILHAELFFATVMDSEPSQFVRPRPAPSAWPEDEAMALAALAQQEHIPEAELPAAEAALQHAWVDYHAARRALELLEPMGAFAADLARVSHDHYLIGRIALATLQQRLRDDAMLKDARVSAEYRLIAIQFTVMELLGRRSAIE